MAKTINLKNIVDQVGDARKKKKEWGEIEESGLKVLKSNIPAGIKELEGTQFIAMVSEAINKEVDDTKALDLLFFDVPNKEQVIEVVREYLLPLVRWNKEQMKNYIALKDLDQLMVGKGKTLKITFKEKGE